MNSNEPVRTNDASDEAAPRLLVSAVDEKNDSFGRVLLEHKKEFISAFSLFGLGLGFWTLFSYASLIGRPELFLASITIGPSLVAWIATFIFCVGVFFVFIWISSGLYLFTVGLFKARLRLKRFVSVCVLSFILLTFSVFIAAAMLTESAVPALFFASLVCFIVVVAVSAFSRSGAMLLKNSLKGGITDVRRVKTVGKKEEKRTKAFKRFSEFVCLVHSNEAVRFVYRVSGLSLLCWALKILGVRFLGFIERKKISIKALYYMLVLTAVLTLCSVFMFYPSYLMYRVTNESGGGTAYALLGAVISFEYGILPGVIYFNSRERGWAKLRKVALILFISAFVVLGATKGVFEKVLSYTALTMGVRLNNVGVYLIDAKYPMGSLGSSGWEVETSGNYHKAKGLLIYQFASVVYLCPPAFAGQKINWWAEHSGSCLLGDKSTIVPFVEPLSNVPAQSMNE